MGCGGPEFWIDTIMKKVLPECAEKTHAIERYCTDNGKLPSGDKLTHENFANLPIFRVDDLASKHHDFTTDVVYTCLLYTSPSPRD